VHVHPSQNTVSFISTHVHIHSSCDYIIGFLLLWTYEILEKGMANLGNSEVTVILAHRAAILSHGRSVVLHQF